LILLSVRGSKDSEKKHQNSCTDKPKWFHKRSLHVGRGCCFLLLLPALDIRISSPSFIPFTYFPR
jgi:hypothetical protein